MPEHTPEPWSPWHWEHGTFGYRAWRTQRVGTGEKKESFVLTDEEFVAKGFRREELRQIEEKEQ